MAMLTRIVFILGAFIFGILFFFRLLINVFLNGINNFTVKTRKQPPKILSDEKYGRHKYLTLPRQGIKLHYVENGDSSKKLLLFVHGFPEFWFSWRNQLTELSKKYWTIAIDLRGYGESDKPKNRNDYAIPEIVADLAEFIESHGSKCVLITHDWGGIVGWELVKKYPTLIEKHIPINGPSHSSLLNLYGRNCKQTLMSGYGFFFQIPWLPEICLRQNDMASLNRILNTASEEELECYKYIYSQDGAFKYPLNYYRTFINYQSNNENRIKVPTFIIWATGSIAVIKEVAEITSRLCDNVKIKYLENCAHLAHQEEPEVINKLIENFIEDDSR